jgi:DNA-binding beta-propeller fold protein YncE
MGFWTEANGQRFNEPHGLAINPRNGDVLVSDTNNQRIVVFDRSGRFIRQFGEQGEGSGQFSHPMDVAVGADGSVYVSDYFQDRIQKFTETGHFLLEWGASGQEDHQFNAPTGLAVDHAGNVYVADFFNHLIKVFSSEGELLRTIGKPGHWGLGRFNYPTDVDVANDERILVADAYNYQVQRFAANGQPQSAWGFRLFWMIPRPSDQRRGFHVPSGVAFSPDGRLIHVADSGNHRVVALDDHGAFVTDWSLPDIDVDIYTPVSIAVSPDGHTVYAADIVKHRIVVLRLERQAQGANPMRGINGFAMREGR